MNELTAFDFDNLCVVSDLHIGGEPGFQIFSGKDSLPWLLRELIRDPAPRLGLAINGDFVDFLAEAPQKHFDAGNAVTKLNRIALNDDSFRETFRALREFLATPGRSLLINLGNHDLELALPPVQARFEELVCVDDAARGRLHWITDGSGVRVQVGRARVLCLHGNETDDWNPVGFETLRRIKLGMLRGRYEDDANPDTWLPNAGTRLVIDAMNAIKRKFPFVDVLKPETEGAMKVLIALDPGAVRAAPVAIGAGLRSVYDGLRKRWGFLGGGAGEVGAVEDINAVALLDEIEAQHGRGTQPEDFVGAGGQTLGYFGSFVALVRGKDLVEALREALQGLDHNQDFDIGHEDPDNARLTQFVGADIDYLVSGHTHFARSLVRAGGYHFNSGTWAYLMQITAAQRADEQQFRQIVEDLKSCSLQQLADKGRLLVRNTVVRIAANAGGAVSGTLQQVDRQPDGSFALNTVASSQRDL